MPFMWPYKIIDRCSAQEKRESSFGRKNLNFPHTEHEYNKNIVE